MSILKLEILKNETAPNLERFDPPRYVWVPTARLRCWYANGDYTTICVDGNGRWHVNIAPDELAAVIDPANACPDGPSKCGYQGYLGRRREGETSDLTHGGYHAAERDAEQHAARDCSASIAWMNGRRETPCSLCMEHERRLRS